MVTCTSGMKAMLLDNETTGIISVVYTHTQIIQKEVYLITKISAPNRAKLLHMKAIVFLRPTKESIQTLILELKHPKFMEYYIFFSNILADRHLRDIAEADEFEVVMQLQELFIDYYALAPSLLSLNLLDFQSPDVVAMNDASLTRAGEGIFASLLSLKKKPMIRYRKSSAACSRIVELLMKKMEDPSQSQLFDFRKTDSPPLLLVLDRRDDPVTPLLLQWTYRAMVHELLTIHNNRVAVSSSAADTTSDARGGAAAAAAGGGGGEKEKEKEAVKEVVLSLDGDEFYASTLYDDFGTLGDKLSSVMEEFRKKTQQGTSVESIADMQRFVEAFPEFRKFKGNVTTHVTLTSELSRIVQKRNLMEVSVLEQDLACNHDLSKASRRLREIIPDPHLANSDRVRLLGLFALRYESEIRSDMSHLSSLEALAKQHGCSDDDLLFVRQVVVYAGHARRQGLDLFGRKFLAAAKSNLRKTIRGVENVYTQHSPFMQQIIQQAVGGKLNELVFPYATPPPAGEAPRVQEILVYITGGATYEEALAVAQMNKSFSPGVRIVLGGSAIVNSQQFMEMVKTAATLEGGSHGFGSSSR